MHTIVCLKVVPKSEEVTIDDETKTLDRSKARSEINPPDMNAVEMALKLKERHGGTVSLLAMGPPLFESYLRLGLAMGADQAFLMSDRAFGGADTLATSYVLAEGIRAIGSFDLVLCGDESSDGATGQVPPGVAEWLGLPQVTYVRRIDVSDGSLRANRELGAGSEVVEADLPCVVSVKHDVNEPRFLDSGRWDWAMNQAPVQVWSAADLKIDVEKAGAPGSPTSVAGVSVAKGADRRREFLSGSPEEIATQLADKIRAWVKP
jgi:electron transfer flavoprotein beta subunit